MVSFVGRDVVNDVFFHCGDPACAVRRHRSARSVYISVNVFNVAFGHSGAGILDLNDRKRTETCHFCDETVFRNDDGNLFHSRNVAPIVVFIVINLKGRARIVCVISLGEAERHLHITAVRYLLHHAANLKIDFVSRGSHDIFIFDGRIAF